MDFKSLQRMAKNLIDKRGGTDALKADAEELKNIATGPGSASDKAKRAADALKDPGAKGPDKTADAPVTPPAETPKPPAAETPVTPPAETPSPAAADAPKPPAADTPATPPAETPAPAAADTPPAPPDAPEPPDGPTHRRPPRHTGPVRDAPGAAGRPLNDDAARRSAPLIGPSSIARSVPRQAWRPRSSMSRFPNSST